jgi:hypothetical protein
MVGTVLCVSKFSSKLCLQLEIRKEAGENQTFIMFPKKEGKGKQICQTKNVSHLTDIFITLPSGLPF